MEDKQQNNDDIGSYKCIGTARTVGGLRQLLAPFADEADFGFLNQPMLALFVREYQDGAVSVVFR